MSAGRGVNAAVIAASAVLIAAGLKIAAPLIVPFLLAAFVTTITAPLVVALVRRGWPKGLAVLAGVLVDLLALAGLGTMVGGSINAFLQRVPQYQERMTNLLVETARWLQGHGVPQADPARLSELIRPGDVVGVMADLVRGATGILSNVVLVLLFVVFMLFEALGMREKLARALQDERTATHYAEAAREINTYMLVKAGASAVTGLLLFLWTWAWGVELPALWGLLAFLLNFIPTIGSIVAAIPPVLLALLDQGAGTALAVAGGYVAVNTTIGNFIEPRILGRALGISPLVVVLSVIGWGWLLGPAGAFLSVPLTMMVKVFLSHTEDLRWAAVLLEPVSVPQRATIPPPPPEPADSPRQPPHLPAGALQSGHDLAAGSVPSQEG